jgi:hypothetical protein
MARSDGRHTFGVNAYRRLASANDFSDPFSFGSSLSALLFGRDEGFYYRTLGAELTGTGDDSATGTWRLFAEHQSDAKKKTNFSLAGRIGSKDFDDNIDAKNGNYFGVAAERPAGLAVFAVLVDEMGSALEGVVLFTPSLLAPSDRVTPDDETDTGGRDFATALPFASAWERLGVPLEPLDLVMPRVSKSSPS